LTGVDISSPVSGEVLQYDGTSWVNAISGAIDGIFYENNQVVTQDHTILSTRNAMSTGPIAIDSGVTVTVSSGARWAII
jgi:hypothetical protein